MATYKLSCQCCSKSFTAKSSQAKWCGPACRKRVERKRASGGDPAADVPKIVAPKGVRDNGLFASVQRDLEDAGRLDTTAGQIALELARELPTSTSKATVSRELRAVLAEALAGTAPSAAASDDAGNDEIEDEIEAARVRREAKIRAATGQA